MRLKYPNLLKNMNMALFIYLQYLIGRFKVWHATDANAWLAQTEELMYPSVLYYDWKKVQVWSNL